MASFALGILDAEDMARFAGHLEYCPRCQEELDDFLEVHARLADAHHDHFLAADQIYRDGQLLDRMLTASSHRRRSVSFVRLCSLGGSALLFVAVVVASLGNALW